MRIEELRIEQTDLNTRRMLDLMAVSSIKGEGMPLYLHVIIRILRDLRMEQQKSETLFNYGKFKQMIQQETTLKEGQLAPLQQRLETLESFMVKTQATACDNLPSKPKAGPVSKKTKSRKKETEWMKGTDWMPQVRLSCHRKKRFANQQVIGCSAHYR